MIIFNHFNPKSSIRDINKTIETKSSQKLVFHSAHKSLLMITHNQHVIKPLHQLFPIIQFAQYSHLVRSKCLSKVVMRLN